MQQKKYEWYRTGFYQGEYEEFIKALALGDDPQLDTAISLVH